MSEGAVPSPGANAETGASPRRQSPRSRCVRDANVAPMKVESATNPSRSGLTDEGERERLLRSERDMLFRCLRSFAAAKPAVREARPAEVMLFVSNWMLEMRERKDTLEGRRGRRTGEGEDVVEG